MPPKVCVVITTCEHFDYAAQAIESCLRHTPDPYIHIIDDGSSNWPSDGNAPPELQGFTREEYHDRVSFSHYPTRAGLLRSWNAGLCHGRFIEASYTVLANDDIVFSPGWFEPLALALTQGYQLVGPVSNAAGHTSKHQGVIAWLPNYNLTDDPAEITATAASLRNKYNGKVHESRINGFFMCSQTDLWFENAYAADEVFCPRNDFDSHGRRNATPTMTLGEDEYQARLRAKGGKSAVVPASFIFHYRSVSRGDKYKKPGWYRRQDQ